MGLPIHARCWSFFNEFNPASCVRLSRRLWHNMSVSSDGNWSPKLSSMLETRLLCSNRVVSRRAGAKFPTLVISLSLKSITSNWSFSVPVFSITAIL